jgi:hypothetical protein
MRGKRNQGRANAEQIHIVFLHPLQNGLHVVKIVFHGPGKLFVRQAGQPETVVGGKRQGRHDAREAYSPNHFQS